jgi:hypothetical protein
MAERAADRWPDALKDLGDEDRSEGGIATGNIAPTAYATSDAERHQ